MKKAIILFTFSMFAISVIAQDTSFHPTQRGNFVIGSRIGFSTSKSSIEIESPSSTVKGDGGRSLQFNIAPALGYFFVENLVLGVGLDWLRASSKTGIDVSGGTAPPQESSSNNVLFGPFMRYFIPIEEDIAFFVGSSLSFGNSKNQYTGNDNVKQSINTSLLTIGVGPGFTIYSRKGFALETLVSYNFANSNSKIDIQGIQRTSQSWTNAVDFSVGVQYYFGGFKSVGVNNLSPD